MQRWWTSVALLLMLAPTALAARDDVDVRADAGLSVVASGSAKMRHEWDWGDGQTSVGAHARHTYREPGVYKVIVTVTDDHGESWRRVREVEVRAPPSRTSWDVEVEREREGERQGRVEAEADVDARAKVAWDWGDGETSRGRRATHRYEASGTYVVTMTVTERDGERWSETRQVRVVVEGERARDGEREGERERDDREHDHGWSVRASVGGASVRASHDHDEDDAEAAYDRWERHHGSSETRIESSSYARHDVPGPGAALAIGAASLGAVALAWRRRAR